MNEAIAHINRYSTKHSEAIVTYDEEHARRFLRQVDSAAVYWNASTRFPMEENSASAPRWV